MPPAAVPLPFMSDSLSPALVQGDFAGCVFSWSKVLSSYRVDKVPSNPKHSAIP